MNRKQTEKRKIEWLEVIPIAVIVISSMIVGWFAYNKAYEEKKAYYQARRELQVVPLDIVMRKYRQSMKECGQLKTEIQQKLKECEQSQKEWEQQQKEWEQRNVPK